MTHKFALILGSTKSGTTSLFKYLNNHPEICGSKLKETRFFLNTSTDNLNSYLKFFTRDVNEKILLEATPVYFEKEIYAQNIYDLLNNYDLKLIVILRNPIDRFISWYKFSKQDGRISDQMSFEKYFNLNFSFLGKDGPQHLKALTTGNYSIQLDCYYKYFEKSNFKILYLEDLVSNQVKILNEICEFLNIDNKFYTKTNKTNFNKTSQYKYPFLNKKYKKFKRHIREITVNSKIRDRLKFISKKIDFIYTLFNKKQDVNNLVNIDKTTLKKLRLYYQQELVKYKRRKY